jgi:hypothetical protein
LTKNLGELLSVDEGSALKSLGVVGDIAAFASAAKDAADYKNSVLAINGISEEILGAAGKEALINRLAQMQQAKEIDTYIAALKITGAVVPAFKSLGDVASDIQTVEQLFHNTRGQEGVLDRSQQNANSFSTGMISAIEHRSWGMIQYGEAAVKIQSGSANLIVSAN